MKRATHQCQPAALQALARALVSISERKEMESFLEELLTQGELCDVTLRWRLLELLAQGVSQRKIAEELQISLCKITRGSRILKNKRSVARQLLSKTSTGHESSGSVT
jgi:TrpR family transcriptional regulator, trp operon repressor